VALPAFLSSCRSLPAIAVFAVHPRHAARGVTLVATLEGPARKGTVCMFLERCLVQYDVAEDEDDEDEEAEAE
jgi:hypothetical protein